MSRVLASLAVNVGLQGMAGFANQLSSIKSMLSGAFSVAVGSQLSNAFSSVTTGLASMVRQSVSFNASMEQTLTSFGVLLGDQEKAKKLMGDIQQFAAKTPFETPQVTQLATQLLATKKIALEQVMPAIQKIGDAAAGSAKGFEALPRVGLAISQMLGKGKIQAEEMNQLAEAGIPAWSALAEETGKSEAELRKMAQAGQLGNDAVLTLIDALGSRFGGMMEKQSKTFNGLWSTIKDNIGIALGKIALPLFDRMKTVLAQIVEFMASADFTSWTTTLAAGMEWFMKIAEAAVKGLISGIQFSIKTVQFLGENWKTVWEFTLAQGLATASMIYDRFKYFLNDQLPFSVAALWEGMVAGGVATVKHLKTIFEAMFDFIKEMWLAIFDSIAARFDGLTKAWDAVKRGRLGDAFEALVQGNVKGATALGSGMVQAGRNFAEATGGPAAEIGSAIADAVSSTMEAMPEFKPSARSTALEERAGELFGKLGAAWNAMGLPSFFKMPEKPEAGPDVGSGLLGGGALGGEAGKSKAKTEFLALDELNKRIQTSIGDKETKDRKRALAAAEAGAKAGGRVAVAAESTAEMMRTLPANIAKEVNVGYVA